MSEPTRTHQEIYDRLREVGREAFILEEMIRYGFWSKEGEIPNDPADEIRRKGQIREELRQLREQSRKIQNEKALRKQLLKERLEASRQKQAENKAKREQARQDRANAWQERKQREIIYLGAGVSQGLNQTDSNLERLQSYNLPNFSDIESLAAAMGITVGELRFLAFDRKIAQQSHYIRFKIPKKTGGDRIISAPMPRLKQAQFWILRNILDLIEPHSQAHGFRRDRSILTNAQPHVGADVIINRDLKDFFPTISYQRVKGLFRSFGYSEAIATIFALLCTEADTETVELDGQTYYIAQGARHLPQGSPASPAISNLICRRLDRRLEQIASDLGFVYTRYADDLTFSASGDKLKGICNILRRSQSIVTHEGFTIHPDKTRILRRKTTQLEVTGIVVNEFPNIDRQTLKRFRATLHHIEQDGLKGKQWGNSPNLLLSIQGFANFVTMVNPQKGAAFQEQIKRIKAKWLNSSN